MKSKASTILLVDGQRNIGGGQIMTKKIAETLQSHYSVLIMLPSGDHDVKKLYSEFNQVPFSFLVGSRGKKSVKDVFFFLYNQISALLSLLKLLMHDKIDLIYVQAPSMLPVCAVLAFIFNKNVISHLHVVHSDGKAKMLLNTMLSLPSVKQIIGVSEYTLSMLNTRNREKSEVLYNQVNVPSITNVSAIQKSDSFSIAMIGDILPQKGQHLLLQAIQNIPVRVDFAGSIIDEEYFADLGKLESFSKAHFLGRIDNVQEFIATHDLVVIASEYETFSLAMVESWSVSVPVIAPNHTGMKELCTRFLPADVNHILYDYPSIQELSSKISFIKSDQQYALSLGRKSREVVEKEFSKQRFSSHLFQIVEKYT